MNLRIVKTPKIEDITYQQSRIYVLFKVNNYVNLYEFKKLF